MKIIVIITDGARVEVDVREGDWLVDPNGTLHIRNENRRYIASWPAGRWSRVNFDSTDLNRYRGAP